jgi:hypothetical protein
MHKQISQAFKFLKWALKNNDGLSKSNVNNDILAQEQVGTQTLCFSGGNSNKKFNTCSRHYIVEGITTTNA